MSSVIIQDCTDQMSKLDIMSSVTPQLIWIAYTGVVNPKPTIGKPCNGQRNVDNWMRGTKTENEKNIK